MAKFCTNCGNALNDGDKACSKCGTMVDGEVKVDSQPQVVVNNVQANPKKSNGLAIAGFVTTLVSTLLCCGSFNLIGLILSIIGLVKSKDLDGAGKGMAIAGIIISAIVMVIGIVLVALGTFSDIISNASYYTS